MMNPMMEMPPTKISPKKPGKKASTLPWSSQNKKGGKTKKHGK
jgi:hypothetical protein